MSSGRRKAPFVDENASPAVEEDFAGADAVFVGGMHVQRDGIDDERAHARGKVTALGGSPISATPERYRITLLGPRGRGGRRRSDGAHDGFR